LFCGWGHERSCVCKVCLACFTLTRKQAYRLAARERKRAKAEEECPLLRKPKPGENYGPPSVPFCDEEFAKKWPNVLEYLITDRWTDGTVRVTSTLSIFTDGVSLKVVLNDRDNNRSAFFCEATFAEAMEAMEDALRLDRVDWKSRSSYSKPAKDTPF